MKCIGKMYYYYYYHFFHFFHIFFSGGRFLWWVALQMCLPPTSPIPLTPYLVVVHVKEREKPQFS
jgi:hypothetical protein